MPGDVIKLENRKTNKRKYSHKDAEIAAQSISATSAHLRLVLINLEMAWRYCKNGADPSDAKHQAEIDEWFTKTSAPIESFHKSLTSLDDPINRQIAIAARRGLKEADEEHMIERKRKHVH